MSRPNLKWTNEQMAIKGFRNLLMFIGIWLLCGILAGLSALMHFLFSMGWESTPWQWSTQS